MTTKSSPVVLTLVAVIAILAAVATGTSLLLDTATTGPVSATSVEDAAMRMYGHGIYQYDSLLVGAGFKGVDIVTTFLGIPLLLISTVLYRRGSLRGGL